jgi:hypothetical protein
LFLVRQKQLARAQQLQQDMLGTVQVSIYTPLYRDVEQSAHVLELRQQLTIAQRLQQDMLGIVQVSIFGPLALQRRSVHLCILF